MDEIKPNELRTFPISELQQRYGIVRNAVYERLKALNIKGERCGKRSYITEEQLQLMDELDTYLKAGNTIDQFIQKHVDFGQIVLAEESSLAASNEEIFNQTKIEQLEEEIICIEQSLEQIIEENLNQLTAEELQGIEREAQQRALARIIARDTLTLLYESNQNFSDPGIAEQFAEHQKKHKQIEGIKSTKYEPKNFLSQSRLFQIWQAGKGG